MKKLKNEKGSTSILMMGLIVGIILMGFVFVDMSVVFMEHRVSQKADDAAALAASIEAKKVYQEKLRDETKNELNNLKATIALFTTTSEGEDGEEESTVDWEGWFAYLESTHGGRPLPASIKAWLRDENNDIDFNEAVNFIWDDGPLSELICQAIRTRWDDIVAAANRYAHLNSVEHDVDVVFPVDGEFKIGTRTHKDIDTTNLNLQLDGKTVPAMAVVNIQQPVGKHIICH